MFMNPLVPVYSNEQTTSEQIMVLKSDAEHKEKWQAKEQLVKAGEEAVLPLIDALKDENSKYYVCIEVSGAMHKYHKFITGWNMVDHIDRNPMNNCLSNLREATHKLNNNNRTKSETSNAIELGVTYSAKDDAYKARIKQDGKEISKQFSVKKYGKDEALRLAIETRKEFNIAYNCLNG